MNLNSGTDVFVTVLRENTNLADLSSLKVSLFGTADCFDEYSEFLRAHAKSTDMK